MSSYVLFLTKLKEKGSFFWRIHCEITPRALGCHKRWKSMFFSEIWNNSTPNPTLLDSLTHKNCKACSSMINLWRDSRTCQKYITRWLTSTGDLWFQIWREFGEFSPNHWKVWRFLFDRLFLFKVYKVWAAKIQRSYLSWHWTVMQNLNKLCLAVSKMAWEIGCTFIRAIKSLKNSTLMGCFCPKHAMFQI